MIRTISIPMAPVGKERPRFGGVRGGKPVVYTPPKTAKAEAAIRTAWGLKYGLYTKKLPCRVTVDAVFKGPSRNGQYHVGKPDADNIGKLVLDALNGIAYVDDCYVCRLSIIKSWGMHDSIFISVEYEE